jgi:hypothetical protein
MFKLFKSKEEKRAEVEKNLKAIKDMINDVKGGNIMVKQELDDAEDELEDDEEEEEQEFEEEDVVQRPTKLVKKTVQLPPLPQTKKVLKPRAIDQKVELTEIVKETEVGFKVPGAEEGQAMTKDGLLLWMANEILEIKSLLKQ